MSDYDVAIIGYGPTGMTLAALLGQLGRQVVVLERYTGLYNLPRAACFDDEIMRTFQKLGLVDEISRGAEVQRDYEWVNGDGETLVEFQYDNPAPGGWAALYMMFQPHIEAVLDRHDRSLPTVEVRQGVTVSEIEQDGEAVTLRGRRPDGAAGVGPSPLCRRRRRRQRLHPTDARPAGRRLRLPGELAGLRLPLATAPSVPPRFRQVCDPAQPTSIVNIGPGYHRFSFMLDPDETGRTGNEARRSLVARQPLPDQRRRGDHPCSQLRFPLAHRRAVASWARIPGG